VPPGFDLDQKLKYSFGTAIGRPQGQDQSSIRWIRLIEDKLIYLKKLEQLICVYTDAGCSRDGHGNRDARQRANY